MAGSDISFGIEYKETGDTGVLIRKTAEEQKLEEQVERTAKAADRAAKAEEKLNAKRMEGIRTAMTAVAMAAQTADAQQTKQMKAASDAITQYNAMRMAAGSMQIDQIFKRGTTESEGHARSLEKAGERTREFGLRVGDVLKGFIAWKGIEGIVDGIKETIGGADERLKSLGEKLDQRAVSMKMLAAAQPTEAAANTAVNEAAKMGTKYKLSDADAARMYLEAQKVAKTPEERRRIAEQMGNLKELGYGTDESIQAIQGGVRAGLSPEQAGALGLRMAQTTGLDIGKASELSQRFSSPYQGAAIMSELSHLGGYKTEKEKMSAIQTVQETLSEDPNVRENKFARFMAGQARRRGMDWTKLNEQQKLELMAQAMPDTSAGALQGRGMKEGATRDISRLIANRGALGALAAPPPDDAIERARSRQESVPYIRASETKEDSDALNKQAELTGTAARNAQDYTQRSKAIDMAAAKYTRGLEERGHPWLASFARFAMSSNLGEQLNGAPANVGWVTRHGMISRMDQEAPGRSGEEWLNRANSAVRNETFGANPEHTAAVRENTSALNDMTSALLGGGGHGGGEAPASSSNRNAGQAGERH